MKGNIALVVVLVVIGSAAVVGADIGDVWNAPTLIKDFAYTVVGLTLAIGAILGGAAMATSRR